MSDSQHRRDDLIAVFVTLEPWDYLPPRMPEVITYDLRVTWASYAALWADLRAVEGLEPCEDTLGALFALYGQLRALGVAFDPLFNDEMAEIGRLATNIDADREPEPFQRAMLN